MRRGLHFLPDSGLVAKAVPPGPGDSQSDTVPQRCSSGQGGPRYYRPELDVLRCVAFFMVFASHAIPGDPFFYRQVHIPSPVAEIIVSMAAGGAFGVDLFFTLSSFLITTLLLRERAQRRALDVTAFYVRRMLRIVPLYAGFLFAAAILEGYLLPGENLPPNYLAAFALFLGNWACVLWGYPHSVASPLWSVSIEEQFYLCWPLVLRRWANRLGRVAVGLLVVSLASRLYLVHYGAIHPQIWCNTLARLDPIACGALVAVWNQRRDVTLTAASRAALFLSGWAILTAAGHFGDVVGIKALVTYPAVTAACVALLVGTLGRSMRAEPGPVARAFIYLGRISYGLYAFHAFFVLLFQVPSTHAPVARVARVAAALLATIVVAAISYQFFERPFLRWKETFTHVESRPA